MERSCYPYEALIKRLPPYNLCAFASRNTPRYFTHISTAPYGDKQDLSYTTHTHRKATTFTVTSDVHWSSQISFIRHHMPVGYIHIGSSRPRLLYSMHCRQGWRCTRPANYHSFLRTVYKPKINLLTTLTSITFIIPQHSLDANTDAENTGPRLIDQL